MGGRKHLRSEERQGPERRHVDGEAYTWSEVLEWYQDEQTALAHWQNAEVAFEADDAMWC